MSEEHQSDMSSDEMDDAEPREVGWTEGEGREDEIAGEFVEIPAARSLAPVVADERGFLRRGVRQDRQVAVTMRKFLTELRKTGKIGSAAVSAGITATRVAAWRNRYPWFDEQVEQVRAGQALVVEDTLLQLAVSGEDPRTTRFVAERLMPDKYGPKKAEEKRDGKAITIRIDQATFEAI